MGWRVIRICGWGGIEYEWEGGGECGKACRSWRMEKGKGNE